MARTPIREAARAALRTMPGHDQDAAHIDRITVDVELGDDRELVSLRHDGERLAISCTCGQTQCEHAEAALLLIGPDGAVPRDRENRASRMGLAPAVPSETRTVDHSDQARRADRSALAEALQDIVTSVARSGVDGDEHAGLEDAVERLLDTAPRPTPLGIRRWLGRLREGLRRGDLTQVAVVLDGASRLVEDLRCTDPDDSARQRIVSWLGALAGDSSSVTRLSARTMIEVGREWLVGLERADLERRYLVDLGDGQIYREERARGSANASLGPCPRIIQVGLAEVEKAAAPRRIRLLQYSASPVIPQPAWQELGSWATRHFEQLAAGYRDAVRAFPGLAEPFALVAPDTLGGEPAPCLLDDSGQSLRLSDPDDAGALRRLDQRPQPAWVAGRLVDISGTLRLQPLSLGHLDEGRAGLERL